ncbi:hypothetical protein J5N97_024395 [Dioscorea zingiberensis]|uniref:Uncharacterized protein n=1 Tax=Dioscorea zingiberensis TaxID=325984 RepID=A0A9D5C6W9_9LILI|nr:hypothetical protein J5N97_024395 [Dioscorea zingiberensis]
MSGIPGAIRAMRPIRYMWSATDSGLCTPRRIHPALFVVWSQDKKKPVSAYHSREKETERRRVRENLESVAEGQEVDARGGRDAGGDDDVGEEEDDDILMEDFEG